ncbi:5-bromo-4-chloroindolyl phosphate hydrolysis family protein [Roseicyclus sp.]|uniref:5-bromo-4-chloroindolyl phosphate hydrolysis family protein n=1 Tax=Roseicyclus sp. TaxID=1914329 RepID=UPI001BCF431A|nr:5-bromo-4-chloroindolyl phosphate hydrolysis family protein [Roseicyclus sp.]
MAQRFGGEFSPEARSAKAGSPRPEPVSFRGRKPMRHGAKLNLLFALALLPLLSVFFQPLIAMATDLVGMGALLLSAWLTRDGVRAEDAFAERKVARRPAIPRKIFGAVSMAAGVGLLVFGGQWAVLPALLSALIAGALHLGAFGLDPLRDKGMEGVDRMQSDRIARKIDEAEKLLAQMRDAIRRARDNQLEDRVAGFSETVRGLFRQVEADPRDLAAARRYLGVYLQGARDATMQFADLYARSRDAEVRADYIAFLDDLDTNFASRTTALLRDDRTNFDIETEVLRDRLNRENLHNEG